MTIKINREIGQVLKDRRRLLGITQSEIAKRTGITQPIVSRIERGYANFTIEQLIKYSNAVGLQATINLSAKKELQK